MPASIDTHGSPERVLMLASNPSVSPTTDSGAAAARLVIQAPGV